MKRFLNRASRAAFHFIIRTFLPIIPKEGSAITVMKKSISLPVQ